MSDLAESTLVSQKQLMLLMTQHQGRIFSYIFTLVPSPLNSQLSTFP